MADNESRQKLYVIDSTVLRYSPHALLAFDDNIVLLHEAVVRDMQQLISSGSSEERGNARQFGALLEELMQGGSSEETQPTETGEKYRTYHLPNHGQLMFFFCSERFQNEPSYKQLFHAMKGLRVPKMSEASVPILVSRDHYIRSLAISKGLLAEEFKSDSIPDRDTGYEGRCQLYVSTDEMMLFHEEGALFVDKDAPHFVVRSNGAVLPATYQLNVNEYVTLVSSSNPGAGTLLGRFDGEKIVPLRGYPNGAGPVYGISPRNVGQRFALDALLSPADVAPLVILKGPAGTAKTFLSMAAALAQTIDNYGGENKYRKILLTRPNTKMDDDIGYLKGDEVQKVMPTLRGLTDNIDNLMPFQNKGSGKAKTEFSALDSLLSQGIVDAQAMAYMRGRSVCNQFIIVDEAQNATITQILSLITRVGEGSKIVILGDPDQIDHPYLDKKNNGLVYAAERMVGSPLCWQVTFDESECARSPLAGEAIARLTPKGAPVIGV